MDFLLRLPFFARFFRPPAEDSRQAARERLRAALVGDRSTVAPGLMKCLQTDLQEVFERYMDIDTAALELQLRDLEGMMTFSARVPVTRIHRQAHLPDAALKEEQERKMLLRRQRRRRVRVRSSEG